MYIALIVLAVLVAFCFGVGCYTFFAACSRGKEINWLDEKAVSDTPYGQYYTHVKEGDRWLREHSAQDVYIESHDGLRLHAKWVPAENPRGTIIFVHGYHSCTLTDFSLAFDLYHDRGMNILLPDHRAHGQSEGKYVTFGVFESRDIRGWIDYHNENLSRMPVICSGLSMGAATVMYVAGMELPENFKTFNNRWSSYRYDDVVISGVEPETIFLILVNVCSLSPGLIRSGLYPQKKSTLNFILLNSSIKPPHF